MSRAVTIQTNFTTGEVDPLLKSRIDINQYFNALDQARNVLIQPQGGIERRPGLQFIFEVPSAANPQNGMKLVPFEFSTTQSYMLLFVHNRMYIFKNKELVTNINSSGNDYLTTTIGSTVLATFLICVSKNLTKSSLPYLNSLHLTPSNFFKNTFCCS